MAFETTYEEFLARVTAQRGAEEATAICQPCARTLAAELRATAAVAGPDSMSQLLRLAGQMDPDRQPAGEEVPDAAP